MTDIESIIRTVVREELAAALAPRRQNSDARLLAGGGHHTPTPRAGDDTPDASLSRHLAFETRDGRGTNMQIGDEILAHLARRRQTQAWLSEQTGIPIATLSRHLRDSSSFRIGELTRIATALDVNIVRLLAP